MQEETDTSARTCLENEPWLHFDSVIVPPIVPPIDPALDSAIDSAINSAL
jgi:hypothetical protein